MRTLLLILLMILHGVYTNAQGYVNVNGGWSDNGDMPFGMEVGALVDIIALKASYTYSNSQDILSLEAGPIAINTDNWKAIMFFGIEMNNNTDSKIGVEVWRRIDHVYVTLRGERFGDMFYGSLGFSIPLVFDKTKKPKRFF